MAQLENSWESLDKARNPEMYETQKLEDGKEVTFLKGGSMEEKNGDSKKKFTKEEEENIAKAAEKMNDKDD